MKIFTLKKTNFNQFVVLTQIVLLMVYLSLNILNVGGAGTGLPLLAGFVTLACGALLFDIARRRSAVHVHFFVFLLFVAWLTFRVVVDLQDAERLKQLTVATTSGVLVFFLIGTFARRALDKIVFAEKCVWAKVLLILVLLVNVYIFLVFKERLMDRDDIIYMEAIEGGYQRPGSFMIMLFIMSSLIYLGIAAHGHTRNLTKLLFWLAVYTWVMVLNLMASQMMGSNAATACILVMYLMTAVVSVLFVNKVFRKQYLDNLLNLPFSMYGFNRILKYSVLALLFGICAALVVIKVTGFDLQKTRIFGFGAGENTSVNSRLEILVESAADQMGHSPFFGNLDVARLTTGDAGLTLHSFIPNVIAELGLVGLLIVVLLFVLVMVKLINLMRRCVKNEFGFMQASLSFWAFLIFIFLFLYANLAVGKEWSVMWFFLGFAISVFCEQSGHQKRQTLKRECGA